MYEISYEIETGTYYTYTTTEDEVFAGSPEDLEEHIRELKRDGAFNIKAEYIGGYDDED